jgi:regulator of protease activity HflC (stomatin/prohibitin superfamily)
MMAVYPTQPDPQSLRLIAKIVPLLLVIFVLLQGIFTVEQGDVGIRLRFGALVGVEAPGIGFKIPLVETIRPMSVRTEKLPFRSIEAYSKDIQAANLQVSLNYHINGARAGDIYSELGINYADRVIVPTTLRIVKEVFGQFNAQNIIIERAALGKTVQDKIAAELEPHGIIVEGFQMEDVSFSDAFEQSIEARMQAEVEVARLRQNLEREKVQADIQRTQAAGQADAMRAKAQAEADSTRIRGEAEAKSIQMRGEALRASPEIIKLTQAERWNGVLPTTMLPSGTLPVLDLNSRSQQ